MKDYFGALVKEITREGKKRTRRVTSVYFGGGTPSLAVDYFPALKEAIFDHFDISPSAEISMEANPESVNDAFVAAAQSSVCSPCPIAF